MFSLVVRELPTLFQAALLSVITSLDMAAISGLAPPSAPAPLLQVLMLLSFP